MIHIKSSIISAKHGFLGRQGGVSSFPYDSLNTAHYVADDPEKNVNENRRRICAALGFDGHKIITLDQDHGADVVEVVDDSYLFNVKADALVTKTPGIPIGILTADCVPILLEDEVVGIVAACHAGWRGAFKGVIGNTIAKMLDLGASIVSIKAATGPCIHQENYEVDADFFQRFVDKTPENKALFQPQPDQKYLFNILEFAVCQLKEHGIKSIDIASEDTYADEDKFFSCRRSFKRGEKEFGRQISLISL